MTYGKIEWFNDLLGPLIFTVINLKKRPAITSRVLYNMDSCPFTLDMIWNFRFGILDLPLFSFGVLSLEVETNPPKK